MQRPKLEAGYDCEFVEEPKELQFECSICLHILRDPYHLDCQCGESFCHTCIAPISKQPFPVCPICSKEFTQIISNQKLKRQLTQRDVYCTNKEIGCKWQGRLDKVEDHLKENSPKGDHGIQCQHCKNTFRCIEVKQHESSCGLRPYKCNYCHKYKSTYDNVREQHYRLCPSQVVPCPNHCGVEQERQIIEDHIKNDCPLTVVDCDFHFAGCKVRQPRKDMPDHLKDNVAHLSLIAAKLREQQDEIHVLKQETVRIRADNRLNAKSRRNRLYWVGGLIFGILALSLYVMRLQQCDNGANVDLVESVNLKHADFEEQLKRLNETIQNADPQDCNCIDAKALINKLESTITSLQTEDKKNHNDIKETIAKLNATVSKPQTDSQNDKTEKLLIKKLENTIKTLQTEDKKNHNDIKETIAKLHATVSKPQTDTPFSAIDYLFFLIISTVTIVLPAFVACALLINICEYVCY